MYKQKKTKFKNLVVFEGKLFKDKRGHLRELTIEKTIKNRFKFQIVSRSKKNVLRGLHLQTKKSQDKYVTVLKGKILDVVVDLRKKSKTYGKHFKIILDENNSKFIFIPKGFAHGFLGLSKENIVLYSCTNYRHSQSEKSILWNDKDLKINWGIKNPIISKKDKNAQKFKDIKF